MRLKKAVAVLTGVGCLLPAAARSETVCSNPDSLTRINVAAIARYLLTASVVMTFLLVSPSAHALTFDFSFASVFGTVTGEIDGLSDNTTNEAATAVYVDSFSPNTFTCSLPCNVLGGQFSIQHNAFSVSAGAITFADFGATSLDGTLFVILMMPGQSTVEVADNGRIDSNSITFTPISTTPVAPSAYLFATALALLGSLFFLRKQRLTSDDKEVPLASAH